MALRASGAASALALTLTLATGAGAVASAQGAGGVSGDSASTRGQMIPAGLGSLRRDDIALTVQVQGLTIRAIPLDEGILRTLAPDSYQSLRAVRDSRAAALERVRSRMGMASVQAWHVTFFNAQPGEARYDPRGMQIRSAGRDFRPLDVIGITPGYDDGRLAQSRTVQAIFIFDAAIQLSQPLVVTLAGVANEAWTDDDVLRRLERERAAIWSRAAAARRPPDGRGATPWC